MCCVNYRTEHVADNVNSAYIDPSSAASTA